MTAIDKNISLKLLVQKEKMERNSA